jgi:hypothetical protein
VIGMSTEARQHGSAGAVRWQAFWTPKKGRRAAEYEDAFAVSESVEAGVPFRAALADGATESVFARRWARLLADGFASGGPAIFADGLPTARAAWAVEAQQDDALPWYTAAKAAFGGAFATLLGLALHLEEQTWQAAGVGDGNLFHLRKGALRRAWPRAKAGAFDNRPALLPSRENASAPDPRRAEGAFAPGDAFVLATDAAAAWLLRTAPAEALAWNGEAAFTEAVRHARAAGLLKNDDTTVVTLQLS